MHVPHCLTGCLTSLTVSPDVSRLSLSHQTTLIAIATCHIEGGSTCCGWTSLNQNWRNDINASVMADEGVHPKVRYKRKAGQRE